MLVFEERGNRSTRRKPFSFRVENQQTQPHDAESGNQTRATLVGGKCSHHCAILHPHLPTLFTLYVLFLCKGLNKPVVVPNDVCLHRVMAPGRVQASVHVTVAMKEMCVMNVLICIMKRKIKIQNLSAQVSDLKPHEIKTLDKY